MKLGENYASQNTFPPGCRQIKHLPKLKLKGTWAYPNMNSVILYVFY